MDEDDEHHASLKDSLADQRESPFDAASHSEMRAQVEEALAQVPEAFRTVVILREMEGMQYDEIAEILKINIGTVKSRLMRGRAALREALAGKGGAR